MVPEGYRTRVSRASRERYAQEPGLRNKFRCKGGYLSGRVTPERISTDRYIVDTYIK